MTKRTTPWQKLGLLAALMTAVALTGGSAWAKSKHGTHAKLSGWIKIDGSSTVFPISEAMAEEFQKEHKKVRVTVGLSGTGGGFKKFFAEKAKNRTDISDASRPIKGKERELARKKKVHYIELPVAYDGIAVVVHPKNPVNSLSVEQLRTMWSPNSKVSKWSDINPKWPNKKITFYAPGADSGTFEYFTKAVNGKARTMRQKNTVLSEDDNVLVQGVSGDRYAIGYFGYAYYAENKNKLKVLAIDGGKGAITPSNKTIEDGTYAPLSRPIFIYVNKDSAKRPEVKTFVEFYLHHAPTLVPQVGYVPLPKTAYTAARSRFDGHMIGTVFGLKKKQKNIAMVDLLKQKGQL